MRRIFIVNATQVVTSENHPEGLYSTMSTYPKVFDSRSFNATEQNPDGDETAALNAAKSDYYSRLSANYIGSPTRVMSTITLERSDGKLIMHDSLGAFPNVTPEPEPEPEPEEEPEPVEE